MAASSRSLLIFFLQTTVLFATLFIPPTSAAARWRFFPSATPTTPATPAPTPSSPPPATTTPSPSPTTTSTVATQYLTPHNQARSAVGVPPLSWSSNLEKTASLQVRFQRDNKACGFADVGNSTYGANQATASYTPTPAEVVALWVAEQKWYTHADNSCVQQHQCGTYTQVVWKNSTQLGCSQAVCKDKSSITICLYSPHGNIIGERPY